jgi:hypothetical protein
MAKAVLYMLLFAPVWNGGHVTLARRKNHTFELKRFTDALSGANNGEHCPVISVRQGLSRNEHRLSTQ